MKFAISKLTKEQRATGENLRDELSSALNELGKKMKGLAALESKVEKIAEDIQKLAPMAASGQNVDDILKYDALIRQHTILSDQVDRGEVPLRPEKLHAFEVARTAHAFVASICIGPFMEALREAVRLALLPFYRNDASAAHAAQETEAARTVRGLNLTPFVSGSAEEVHREGTRILERLQKLLAGEPVIDFEGADTLKAQKE